MSNYNMKEKSIFCLFSKYDEKLVKTAITTIESGSYHKNLLIRKYGINYDGESALNDLNFNERNSLINILKIIEERLIGFQKLIDNGWSLNQIYNSFKNKKSSAVVEMLKYELKKYTKEPKLSLNYILSNYNLTIKQLENIIEFNNSEIIRTVLKSYLELRNMTKYDVMGYLNIDEENYNFQLQCGSRWLFSKISEYQNNDGNNNVDSLSNVEKNIIDKKVKKIEEIKSESILKSFFNLFYKDNMTKEEKEKINQFILCEIEEVKGTKTHDAIISRYGSALNQLNKANKLTQSEYSLIYNFRKKIEKKLNSFSGEERKSTNLKGNLNHLKYIDLLILKAYFILKKPNLIAQKLLLDIDFVLDNIITNFELYEDKNEIINYIIFEYPSKIKDLLNSRYFTTFMLNLTDKEQQLIYLKLLSKTSEIIDDNFISQIIGIDIDTISKYQIMTKYDNFNELNRYIKVKK